MNRTTALVIATAAIAALAWIDPLYLPLVGLGPLLGGAAAGVLGARPRDAAVPWAAAGLITLLVDLAANGEDVAFHAVVAVLTAALAAGVAAAVRGVRSRRAVPSTL